jgi:hypothetical protein
LATVEAALGRARPPAEVSLRTVAVPSRHLPPSGGHAFLDHVSGFKGADLAGDEPMPIRDDEVRLMGWAHIGAYPPAAVEVFVALEALDGSIDRIFRAETRTARPDVVAAFSDFPASCGFDVVANVAGLTAGNYRVAIVQRTPDATYRDATPVILKREEASCSND